MLKIQSVTTVTLHEEWAINPLGWARWILSKRRKRDDEAIGLLGQPLFDKWLKGKLKVRGWIFLL